mmetsp:Transcript_38104/g.89264  ORF Transcript_38104/g.89264 Transcript_38104/m.89264 type:complete len:496 (+) Transcript_38104:119-1606(+)
MAEVSLFSKKVQKYGVLGAGLIHEPLAAVEIHAQREAAGPQETSGSAADLSAEKSKVPVYSGGPLTRQQILHLLTQTARVQGIIQQEISALARKLVNGKSDKKKKPKQLSFLDAYKKMLELNLPQDPLEEYGLTEASFQKLLSQYEDDAEVMQNAQLLLHPAGKGDPARARELSLEKIIEIHQFMVMEMQKVINEFREVDREVRRTFTGKGCETTAELLVSMAVEQRMSVRCEDVEQAVILYEEQLQANPDFARATDQLADMMHQLIGSVQLRVQKEQYVQLLTHMNDSARKAKAFTKKLHEDYRSKSIGINEAYLRFEEFTETSIAESVDLPELSHVELQAAYEEYQADEEVRRLYAQIGAAAGSQPEAAAGGAKPSKPLPASEDKKAGKKLKAAELVEMQVLMVDELRRLVDDVVASLRQRGGKAWKADIAVQMAHGLTSATVEKRYGMSAEELAQACLSNAASLQRSERFIRSTEEQHELMTKLSKLSGGGK